MARKLSLVTRIIIMLISFTIGSLVFFVVFVLFFGMLEIESSRPPLATVQIDGIVEGTTPLKQRVRTGVHQVMVYKEGFEIWRGEVKVRSISKSTISIELPFMLRSEPTGAEVIMDGERIGVTDMAIDLIPGTHTFEFRKDGYRSEKFNAIIPSDANEPIPVVTLTPAEEPMPEERWPVEKPSAPEYGSIQVTSLPDAQVYLDGEFQGETPLTIERVLVGSYVITLSKDGYRDVRRTVYVRKDETTRFAGELKAESVEEF